MRISLLWELLEVFRCFWIHLVKTRFVDLWQQELFQQTFIWRTWGLLTGNLESSLPVETSAQGSGVRSSFNEQKLLCHLTWHQTDRGNTLSCFASCFGLLVCFFVALFVVFVFPCDWSCCVWSEKKEFDVSMWESSVKQFSWHDSDPELSFN